MASSSTSCIHKSFEYEVFLSFRGEDTRANFIDHLYYALQQKGIRTYKDDERIKKGKRIGDELIRSIENSKFYVIVFSKNYASSSWCLDELVKIMECHNTTEHTAYPVFYDVGPSEVRKQSGAVEEAFAKHEKKEVSGKWREALKDAADLAGWELKNTSDGHEAKFIQKVVEELSLELRSINFRTDEKLVGMDTRIKGVVSYLGTGFDDVRIIGIRGIGGGGKTALARAVFDEISFQFEGNVSFVENVREVSNASFCGLKSLQNQILLDVWNDQGISVRNVHDGKKMMKRMMPTRKVLLVLDDVDHISQLEALAGEPNWFMPGSVIIITTRDEQVLISHGVKLIYNVNLLSNKEAICLFNRHAFGREIPIQGYEELSGQVVRYAAGLPLTIRVLGSFLCGKSKLEWVDAVERLKTIPLAETLEKLELSYLGLEEDYKEMFLDVACILKGRRKHLVIKVLESCGFHARNGLRVLEQKSLITISVDYFDNEYVSMHDHLEEMGMNIVRRAHPNKPNKHSRLWINEEIEDILANDLGTEATRYILYDTEEQDLEIVTKGFRKMKELRFLDMSRGFINASNSVFFHWNCKFKNISPYFPNSLRYLRWRCYPFRYLPKTFNANNLVSLEMPRSRIVQLWKGGERKVLNKLRFLDLSDSKLRTLDLGLTPNLETLALERCFHLVKLHMPDGCLKLRYLNISNSKLKTIDLRLALNLETLILQGCPDLVELHMPAKCLNLRSIVFKGLKLRTLGIGLAPNLLELILEKCFDLEELHMADECQKLVSVSITHLKLRTLELVLTPNLESLVLQGCFSLVELHMPSRCLNLRSLKLRGLKLRTLDIGQTPKLNDLILEHCLDLEEIHMTNECQKLVSVSITHLKLRTLDLGLTPNLEKLELSHTKITHLSPSICMSKQLKSLKFQHSCLEKLPEDLGRLECLEELNLSHTNIKHLSDSICMLKHLKSLSLDNCSLLEKLPQDLGQLGWLEKLNLSHTMIKHLPESICMLKHLKSLNLNNCLLLEKLHEDLGKLKYLEELYLSHTKIKNFPDSIFMLKKLESLELNGCLLIEKVPEALGRLKWLMKLDLSHTKIKHLPSSICMLKHLVSLKLSGCSMLEKLPEDLGRLEWLEKLLLTDCKCLRHIPDGICKMKYLQVLDIQGTSISHLPQSLLLLTGLTIFGSREVLQSFGFTSSIQTVEYSTTACYVTL